MQRFNVALSPEDKKFVRRMARIMLIVYSSTAFVLTAWVAAHIALKNSTTANASIEFRTKPEAPASALSLR